MTGSSIQPAAHGRDRRVWILVASVAGFGAALLLWPFLWFAFSYGADFDYPQALPVPPASSVVLSDTGADDDQPLRSRQQVVDVPSASTTSLPDFYRQAFPTSRGWSELPVEGAEELCLINRNSNEYDEVVEVFNYSGTRVPTQPGRHLVMITRFDRADDVPCGVARAWMASDLL